MNSKHLIVLAIIMAVVIAAGVAWYFYSEKYLQDYLKQGSDTTENINYEDDSTAEISADLQGTAGDASLNGEFDALNEDMKSF